MKNVEGENLIKPEIFNSYTAGNSTIAVVIQCNNNELVTTCATSSIPKKSCNHLLAFRILTSGCNGCTTKKSIVILARLKKGKEQVSELHISDEETDGNRHHIRQYDEESYWTVEVVDDKRAIKHLATIGAESAENRFADSALFRLDTAQLIGYLAEIGGYRAKVTKKVKRQYSPEHRAALTERLRKINATKNAILV